MSKNSVKILIIFIFCVLVLTSCSQEKINDDTPSTESTQTTEAKATTESAGTTETSETTESAEDLYKGYFDAVKSNYFTLEDHLRWLDTYMSILTPEQASDVLTAFEEIHRAESFKLMEKLYVEGSSEPVKSVADAAPSLGYKLEPVEGSLNMIIDYNYYLAYLPFVTEDVADFYRLMKVESDDVPLKDAGIVISWESLFERAVGWESYINTYPNAVLKDRGEDSFLSYQDWSYNGAPNTPVFDWDQNRLTEEYQQGIELFLSKKTKGAYSDALRSFYNLVQEQNYIQNDQIQKIQLQYVRVYE